MPLFRVLCDDSFTISDRRPTDPEQQAPVFRRLPTRVHEKAIRNLWC